VNTTHRPDPQFVDNLEHELRSTIRRRGRFDNGPSANGTVIRKLRWTIGVVALAAMCVGSAGTFAVTHRLRSQAADLIIARAEAPYQERSYKTRALRHSNSIYLFEGYGGILKSLQYHRQDILYMLS